VIVPKGRSGISVGTSGIGVEWLWAFVN
jgi:hypothetical protein